MTGSDLPILLALALVTGYFLYRRRRVLSNWGYGLLGSGLVVLTLTMAVDWLFIGIDHVLPVELDPDLSTTLIAYLGFVPGILLIGIGLTVLLPRLDRLAEEIVARRAAEQAAESRAGDLLEAKQQAEQANAAKSRFLASMSHELRTPLNAIIGFGEVLEQAPYGPLGDPRYRGYAADIQHSGRHLLAIINDILDMSKIEAGAERLTETEVELGIVLDTAVRMVEAEYAKLGIALDVDRALDGCRVRIDQVKLSRVLINLLSNAMKFTESGGQVSLRTGIDAGGALRIAVEDTGIGMSEAEIATALTPFGQAGAIAEREHRGTGLGLPIAKAVIELHGGRFEVASTPGRGTTVTIILPPARVTAREAEPHRAAGD